METLSYGGTAALAGETKEFTDYRCLRLLEPAGSTDNSLGGGLNGSTS